MESYLDVDWDTFWRWEIFYRRRDPVDFMRWKADSSRALRELPIGRDVAGLAPLILDATCGLGYHAMAQRRLGFRVEACDACERALTFASESIRAEGLEIPTFLCTWESLGDLRPGRYDLIFNDEVHQVFPERSLRAVLSSFQAALKPGGAFVFFYADRDKPDNGPGHAEWDWRASGRPREVWRASDEEREVILEVWPERISETMIFEDHRYRICDLDGSERQESTIMPRNYYWDWAHILPLLREVGFEEVTSHHFVNVDGNSFSMNLAARR